MESFSFTFAASSSDLLNSKNFNIMKIFNFSFSNLLNDKLVVHNEQLHYYYLYIESR